jgi:hypothetical protein
MLRKVITISLCASFLFAAQNSSDENKKKGAERGAFFYEFNESNNSNESSVKNNTPSSTQNTIGQNESAIPILKELLKVAKEQRDIQREILNLLSEEFHPTPKKVVINGKECIANSSADCFVMPVTKEAEKIPVLKELIVSPSPETAKNYLQWQAKYFSTGPFKVGRSFEYAMNTWGEEAYPMDMSRPHVNTTYNTLSSKQEEHRQILLNKLYASKKIGLYIFLQSQSLDYFSLEHISGIIDKIDSKKAVTLVFKDEADKRNVFKSIQNTQIANRLNGTAILVDKKVFDVNNIYMTPTYTIAIKTANDAKKQAVAIGRISSDELNRKIYEYVKNEKVVEPGDMMDYKTWNTIEDK